MKTKKHHFVLPLIITVIIILSPQIQSQSFPKTDGISFGAGAAAFANYIGPVLAIGHTNAEMHAELYFNYFATVIQKDANLFNDSRPGFGTLGLSYIPNFGKSSAFKYIFGFGSILINEETGSNYLPPKEGRVAYVHLYVGSRYYMTSNLYLQSLVGFGFITDDKDGLLVKEKMGGYKNSLTFQLAAMLGF